MLTYNIDERGHMPIYEFLYSSIREDILNGSLKMGEKLPSKRELAADNGVALITVENAYEQLITEGYVEARPRRGYFVAEIGEPVPDYGHGLFTEDIYADTEDNGKNDRPAFDFTSATLQSDNFPYTVWTRLIRKVISEGRKEFALTPPGEGIPELRSAIAGYLRRAKGIVTDPDRIIIGAGTEYLHSLLLQLIGRNGFVAVEDPGYKKVGLIYESNGMKVRHIPLDDDGLMVDRLEQSSIRLLHVSPSHHFPTGTVMTAGRRHRLVSWAMAQNAMIIEDDYDSEFRFKGKPLPPLMSLCDSHVVYMNTFTGALSPAVRIAYMVLTPELKRMYDARLSYVSGTVSTMEQQALAGFISGGYYERHINRMRNLCRKLKDVYSDALEHSGLKDRAEIRDDRAGLNFVLLLPSVSDDVVYMRTLKNRGICLRSVSDYCYNTASQYKHRFILRYIEMDREALVECFNIMAECII